MTDVRITHCGLDLPPLDLPDAGEGVCCYGAAVYGPQRYTCWEPVYDADEAPIITRLPTNRRQPCDDCVFRPDSPERTGDPTVLGDQDDLDVLVQAGRPFYCHKGMRRPVAWRHPAGIEVPARPSEHHPQIVNSVPYKADGTPADVCAGWATRRRLVEMDLEAGRR